jgi:hypothetical protein
LNQILALSKQNIILGSILIPTGLAIVPVALITILSMAKVVPSVNLGVGNGFNKLMGKRINKSIDHGLSIWRLDSIIRAATLAVSGRDSNK